MGLTDVIFTVIEAVVWLGFIWFGLFTLRYRTGLWWSSLVLLTLAYLGFLACPLIRETEAWGDVSRYGIKEFSLGLVEAVLWYAFIWFGLDTIRSGRKLWYASLVLLALFNAAFLVCPWVRDTEAWHRLWR